MLLRVRGCAYHSSSSSSFYLFFQPSCVPTLIFLHFLSRHLSRSSSITFMEFHPHPHVPSSSILSSHLFLPFTPLHHTVSYPSSPFPLSFLYFHEPIYTAIFQANQTIVKRLSTCFRIYIISILDIITILNTFHAINRNTPLRTHSPLKKIIFTRSRNVYEYGP